MKVAVRTPIFIAVSISALSISVCSPTAAGLTATSILASDAYEPANAFVQRVSLSFTASNLVHGDTNSRVDVLMYDRLSHATRLISVGRDGKAGHGASYRPAISANARLVTFLSGAANLVLGDSNPAVDVFVAAPSGG